MPLVYVLKTVLSSQVDHPENLRALGEAAVHAGARRGVRGRRRQRPPLRRGPERRAEHGATLDGPLRDVHIPREALLPEEALEGKEELIRFWPIGGSQSRLKKKTCTVVTS